MRIHRLKLRNVKAIEDREVAFPDRGVIVVEGPNEVGKTTMVEALDVLLEEKDSSRKRHVVALRPVGQDVPTTIEAELSFGPYRFRYHKQWFRQPATELHVMSPQVEQLTGVAAHERVAAIIAETTDVALWRALRLMQATPLGQVELGGSTALSTALDVAAQALLEADPVTAVRAAEAGGAEASEGAGRADGAGGACADGLVAAAEGELARYFTAGRGQPTGEYRAALDAVAASAAAERIAAAAVAEVEDDVARHEELVDEADRATRAHEAATADAAALADHWAAIRALEQQHLDARREATTADREVERARERHADRARLVADIEGRQDSVAAQERGVALLVETLGPDEAELAAAVIAHAEAAARLARCTARVRQAELAEQVGRSAAEVEALADRLTRAESIDRDRREVAAELASTQIDERSVRRAERALAALDLARSDHAADSARVSMVALHEQQAILIDGTEVVLAAGQECERSLGQELEIVVPGRLALRWHPESAAGARAAAVTAAEREFATALAAVGTADLAAACDRLDRQHALTDRLARSTDRLADVLAGATLDRLRDDLAAAQAQLVRDEEALRALAASEVHAAAEARPVDDEGPPDAAAPAEPHGTARSVPDEPGLAELRRRAEAAAGEVAGHAARAEALRAAVAETRMAHVRAESLLAAARRELTGAEERLARLRETDDDASLLELLADAESAQAAARHRLAATGQALEGVDVDETRLRVHAGTEAVRASAERVAALRDQRVTIEARLEHCGRQGRYEALESARGTLEHAQRKLASVRRRAEAARLLHDTLQSHRAATKRRYVAPFAAAIQRLGKVVYGPSLAVEIGESLAIEARVLEGDRIGYDALSTGAKEQLAILTRLAVATLIDAQQGVPVVIDDALGYSDPGRLRRMTAAFSLVGADAQVILLTCTPGRYDGIVGAHVIRLGEAGVAPVRAAG